MTVLQRILFHDELYLRARKVHKEIHVQYVHTKVKI
jgi:hypothetical protein